MAAARSQHAVIVAVAAVVSLALWPIELESAFGLPAHPLIIHVPVVFVPLLGSVTLALAVNASWFERYGVAVAAFSVLTLAATTLAIGAGKAFEDERERELPRRVVETTLHDHRDAGITLRLTLLILTALLVGMLFTRQRLALRVLAGLLALTAIVFVIRTGHLGAQLVWDQPPGR